MIGYVEKAVGHFTRKDTKAQTVPASLFWREEGLGIFYDPSTSGTDNLRNVKSLQAMPFNLFVDEKNRLSFRVSDHPLQDGSTISDHVHQELREVTVTGMYTNHPLRRLSDVEKVTFRDDYGEAESVKNTALENFGKLVELAKARKPVRLVCSLEVYPMMVITSIDYERNKDSGSSIRFTMTLRELRTASLRSVAGTYNYQPESLVTANDRLIASKKNAGNRSTEEASADEMNRILNPEII